MGTFAASSTVLEKHARAVVAPVVAPVAAPDARKAAQEFVAQVNLAIPFSRGVYRD
jgi:hypothetical protein